MSVCATQRVLQRLYMIGLVAHAFPSSLSTFQLGIDVVSSLLTYYYCKKITDSLDDRDALASVLSATDSSIGPTATTRGSVMDNRTATSPKASQSTFKLMQQLARFYRGQTILSSIGGIFAVCMFVIQFVAKVEALSLIACIFCVCMYVIYACRRVPILIMYTHWQGYIAVLDVLLCRKGAEASAAGSLPAVSKYSSGTDGKSSIGGLHSVPRPLPLTKMASRDHQGPSSPSAASSPRDPMTPSHGAFGGSGYSQTGAPVSFSSSSKMSTRPHGVAVVAVEMTSVVNTAAAVPASPSTRPMSPASPRAIRLHIHPSSDFSDTPALAATIARLASSPRAASTNASSPRAGDDAATASSPQL